MSGDPWDWTETFSRTDRRGDWSESDRALCLCGKDPGVPGPPITNEDDCPYHGEPS